MAAAGEKPMAVDSSLPLALGLALDARLLRASLTARVALVAQPAEDARLLAARAGHTNLLRSERAPTIRRRCRSVQMGTFESRQTGHWPPARACQRGGGTLAL